MADEQRGSPEWREREAERRRRYPDYFRRFVR